MSPVLPASGLLPSADLTMDWISPLDPAYDLRLGPLTFTWPSDVVEETLGDTLEAVGAAITAGGRRPRPLKLPVRIEAPPGSASPTAVGRSLRRRVRQLLENRAWLQHGLYLWWRADEELGGWVRLGGGTIRESDPGTVFAIYDLELESPYLVGRHMTHRPGRRLDLADRRTGLVPRDTRRTLYNADFASQPSPSAPLIIPGDTASWTTTVKRVAGVNTPGPIRDARRLYRALQAIDGEVATYSPNRDVLTMAASANLLLDEPGSTRVWDLSDAAVYPPDDTAYETGFDIHPDDGYGWERVLGAQIRSTHSPLAIDNGLVRLVWLGHGPAEGLALEWWDPALEHYRREGRILNRVETHAAEVAVIEITPERAVVEWRTGEYAMRAILQRGWAHARLESYNDTGAIARLEYAAPSAITHANASPSWVQRFTAGGRDQHWATGAASDMRVAATQITGTDRFAWTAQRTVVAQIGTPPQTPDELASWSLVDARSVPVVVGRA